MDSYIRYMSRYRGDRVRLGLELDVNRNGEVTLRDEHAGFFDVFLGAVHYINEDFTDIDRGFMWSVEALCDFDVDTLAHPFRIYLKKGIEKPVHLYSKVAKVLARYDVAAEINFHINEPDTEFFRICIENGVRLAFGSDAHCLEEVCGFDRNFELLENIYEGKPEDILLSFGG
jgi:histidinol phosphatase-like PHP family hydrolase